MANTLIQIKRSTTTAVPPNASLSEGEQAYSFASNTLFIGAADGVGVISIGGKYWVDTTIAAFNKANSANLLAFNTGIGANTWANTKLANTTGTFAGTLTIANDLVVTGNATFDTDTMYVDATNNRVGIRTITPYTPFDVRGTTDQYSFQVPTSGSARYVRSQAGLSSYSGYNLGLLHLSGTFDSYSTVYNGAMIGALNASAWSNTNSPADMILSTTSFNSTTPSEKVRITSNGNVGIGISAPTAKLTVANGTSATSQHIYGTYTDVSNYERINLTANSSGHYIIGQQAGTGSARPLYLGANNATAVTIDGDGNIGVGTSSPAVKLDVVGSGRFLGYVRSLYLNTYDNSKSIIGNPFNYTIIFDGNGNESIRILSNGNVGIGNTAPQHKLRVEGTVSIAGNTTPSANLTYDLGSPTLYWNNVYSNNIVTNSASFSNNVSVGGTLSVTNNIVVNKNLDITSKNVVGLTSLEAAVLTTFHVGDYKGGKFTIMAKRGNDTHMAEVMLTHNVESTFYNEYSVIYSNTSLFNVSADISGNNVRLLATASTPSDIQFQVMENKFAVDLDVYDRAGTLLLDRFGSVIDERRITR